MQHLIKQSWRKLYSFAAERIVKQYIRKDREYRYDGLQLKIYKNVFHPGLFRSTRVFAEWLKQQDLAGKTCLELGCGSAMLSLIAARKGATVYAVDINPIAVENAQLNAAMNKQDIIALRSDLFSDLTDPKFSIVLINPPFFPKHPQSDYDHAWFCGEHFEYFEKLFEQLKGRPAGEKYYMILSDTCDVQQIRRMAEENAHQLTPVYKRKVSGEMLIIYQLDHREGD